MSHSSKQQMLQQIKQALGNPVPVPFPLAQDAALSAVLQPAPAAEELAVLFAENFTQLQGHFSYGVSATEWASQLQILGQKRNWQKWFCNDESLQSILATAGFSPAWTTSLADCQVSITGCEALVARTGTMVLSSQQSGGRTPSIYAPIHLCVATVQQLVYDIGDAFQMLQKKYGQQLPSQLSFASGPSRTADIEKTLVTGVHGPKEVYCFLLEEM
jgi:L-lactate dehydrogenase complex protein LldG